MKTLYRAKSADTSEWVYFNRYGIYCDIEGNELQPKRFTRDCGCKVLEETEGQYTGDNPAAEERIFRDDIVKIIDLADNEFVGVVKYAECAFWVDDGKEAHRLWSEVNRVIKLGNIHDNPELIEAVVQ